MPIETERLILRRWTAEDAEPIAAIHADPEVMYWHGRGPMTRVESDDCIARYEEHFDQHGFGFWAVERKEDGALIGMSGLRYVNNPDYSAEPCVEMGWRLTQAAWGRGYATEAARAALDDGLERVALPEVVAWTATTNLRSQGVMRGIGMQRDPARDFEATILPPGHPLRTHIVFRVTK
jgi:RimJ/RimL family protein N-acetyltransferase